MVNSSLRSLRRVYIYLPIDDIYLWTRLGQQAECACYAMLCYAMLQISYRYVAHVPTAEQGLVPACVHVRPTVSSPAQQGSIQQRFVRLAAVQGHIIVAKTRSCFGIPTRNISTRDRFQGVIVTGPNRLARCRAGPVHSLRAAVSLGTEPGPSIRAATFNFMIGMRHEAQWHNDVRMRRQHGSRVTGSSTMRIRTQHVRSG